MRVMVAALLSLLVSVSSIRAADVIVFAPPLLEKPLETLAAEFYRNTGITVEFSFDSQKSFVQRLISGESADIVIGAGTFWLSRLKKANIVIDDYFADLCSNPLVLVSVGGSDTDLKIDHNFRLSEGLSGEQVAVVAPGDSGSEGEAVTSLLRYGSPKEVGALIKKLESARDVILQVSRGEVKYGVVHSTTLPFFKGISVVGILPDGSRKENSYGIAQLPSKNQKMSKEFFDFLVSEASDKFFSDRGFEVIR